MIADKGYYSYKNYLKGITRFRIVPLISEEELQFKQSFRLTFLSSGRVLFQQPEKGCFHKVGEEIQGDDFKMGEIQIYKK